MLCGGREVQRSLALWEQKCTSHEEAAGKEKPTKSVCWWRLISYFPLRQQMWGRASEPLGQVGSPRGGEPSSAAIFRRPKPGGIAGSGSVTPAGWKDTTVSRSCSPALGTWGGARLLVVSHGFALLSQTFTLLSTSLQVVVTGILQVCQHTPAAGQLLTKQEDFFRI